MKSINRITIAFGIYAGILFCMLFVTNIYINMAIFYFATMFFVCFVAYVGENKNSVEKEFVKKIQKKFNF